LTITAIRLFPEIPAPYFHRNKNSPVIGGVETVPVDRQCLLYGFDKCLDHPIIPFANRTGDDQQ
jgi:hypothetical protein